MCVNKHLQCIQCHWEELLLWKQGAKLTHAVIICGWLPVRVVEIDGYPECSCVSWRGTIDRCCHWFQSSFVDLPMKGQKWPELFLMMFEPRRKKNLLHPLPVKVQGGGHAERTRWRWLLVVSDAETCERTTIVAILDNDALWIMTLQLSVRLLNCL